MDNINKFIREAFEGKDYRVIKLIILFIVFFLLFKFNI